MKCKEIQEWLMSDYFDGELNREKRERLEEHLAGCPQCRALQRKMLSERTIFLKAERKPVPEHLWKNIHDAILAERVNPEIGKQRVVLEKMRNFLFPRQPVFALANIFAVMIFVVVLAGSYVQKQRSNNERGLIGYGSSINSEDFVFDLGTDIEQYFL